MNGIESEDIDLYVHLQKSINQLVTHSNIDDWIINIQLIIIANNQ